MSTHFDDIVSALIVCPTKYCNSERYSLLITIPVQRFLSSILTLNRLSTDLGLTEEQLSSTCTASVANLQLF
jgi:hypothetical protein